MIEFCKKLSQNKETIMGTGFARKKKEAKQFQHQMTMLQQTLSSQLATLEVEGSAGNGLVTIQLAGSGEIKKITIKPECVDPEDIGGLEALIKAAHQEAFKKLQQVAEATPTVAESPLFG
jgi:nucleoid-associated protein EbfC